MDRRTDGRLTIAIPRFALRASRGNHENLKGNRNFEKPLSVKGLSCYMMSASYRKSGFGEKRRSLTENFENLPTKEFSTA